MQPRRGWFSPRILRMKLKWIHCGSARLMATVHLLSRTWDLSNSYERS